MLKGYAAKVAEVPVFAEMEMPLKGRLAEILASIGEPRVLGAAEVLYAQGAEDSNTGAILIEGTLAVSPKQGEPIHVKAPDLLGEMQQFDDFGQRTATVTALGPVTILEFGWHEFVARVRDTPSIGQQDQRKLKSALEAYASRRVHHL